MNKFKDNPYLSAGVLTPVGIIVVLCGYAFETMKMGNIVKNGLPSASFFPFLLFIFGLPVAVYLLVTGLLEVKKQIAMHAPDENVSSEQSKQQPSEGYAIKAAHKPFLITALTFVFVILFKILGYSVTAPLYLFFFQIIYDDKLGKFTRKAIVSVIVTIFVYALYVGFFNIQFPEVWK